MVTLTVDQLAAALRLGDGTTALTGPLADIIARLLSTATALVLEYSPTADDAVANEAVIRLAGFLYDADPAAARRFADPMGLSGARSILAPFRSIRAQAIGTAPDA